MKHFSLKIIDNGEDLQVIENGEGMSYQEIIGHLSQQIFRYQKIINEIRVKQDGVE